MTVRKENKNRLSMKDIEDDIQSVHEDMSMENAKTSFLEDFNDGKKVETKDLVLMYDMAVLAAESVAKHCFRYVACEGKKKDELRNDPFVRVFLYQNVIPVLKLEEMLKKRDILELVMANEMMVDYKNLKLKEYPSYYVRTVDLLNMILDGVFADGKTVKKADEMFPKVTLVDVEAGLKGAGKKEENAGK